MTSAKLFSLCVICIFLGCSGVPGTEDAGTGGGSATSGGGSSATGGGSATTGGGSAAAGGGNMTSPLGCQVETILTNKCITCHGTTPISGAPVLNTLAALRTNSMTFVGSTHAQRSQTRMTAQTMPPGGGNTPAELTSVGSWISGGMLDCGSAGTGGGSAATGGGSAATGGGSAATGGGSAATGGGSAATGGGNAGPCVNGPIGPTGTGNPRSNMQPGVACKACHGPPGNQQTNANYRFMGTLFPRLTEPNFCRSMPPSGAVIEILNLDGGVAVTMTPNTVGNFFSTTTGVAMPSPYLAQVRIGTRIRKMNGSQTNGDCNSCHTANGTNGAPGRIISPP